MRAYTVALPLSCCHALRGHHPQGLRLVTGGNRKVLGSFVVLQSLIPGTPVELQFTLPLELNTAFMLAAQVVS